MFGSLRLKIFKHGKATTQKRKGIAMTIFVLKAKLKQKKYELSRRVWRALHHIPNHRTASRPPATPSGAETVGKRSKD